MVADQSFECIMRLLYFAHRVSQKIKSIRRFQYFFFEFLKNERPIMYFAYFWLQMGSDDFRWLRWLQLASGKVQVSFKQVSGGFQKGFRHATDRFQARFK